MRAASSPRPRPARRWSLCALAIATAPLGPALGAPEPRVVAVLELHDTAEVGEDAARFLAEQVRGAALQLPRAEWFLMTRENLEGRLPAGEHWASCTGDCEIATGKAIGAQVVVTGDITRLGGELKLSLKAHDTASGRLLAQHAASSATVEGLDPAAQSAAGRLFEGLAGGDAPAEPASLSVRAPGGVVVSINGVELGAAPTAARKVGAGTHEVAAEGPCHRRVALKVEVAAGEQRQVTLDPPARRVALSVEAVDADGQASEGLVFVDGQRLGKAPGRFEVPACAEEVRVEGPAGRWSQRLDLRGGKAHGLTATLGDGASPALSATTPARESPRRAVIIASAWWLAAGAASVGLGGLMAWSNDRDGRELQKNPGDTALREEVDQSHRASITFYVLGGLALGLGATGLIAAWLTDEEPAPAAGLHFGVGPGAVGVGGTF